MTAKILKNLLKELFLESLYNRDAKIMESFNNVMRGLCKLNHKSFKYNFNKIICKR